MSREVGGRMSMRPAVERGGGAEAMRTEAVTRMQLEPPADLLEAIGGASPLYVAGHVSPDADCVGSMLGLGASLERSGRSDVRVVLPEGAVSRRLGFLVGLSGAAGVVAGPVPEGCTLLALDTARVGRIHVGARGERVDPARVRIVCIDHHHGEHEFAAVRWVEPEASSTSEMVYWLIRRAGWVIDAGIASCLYAGIVGDTVGFTLPNTTASALRAASELVQAGADVAAVGERLHRSLRQGEFDLLRIIYANTRCTADGRIAYSTASYEEITACGCSAADIDDQVSVPRVLEGIRIAMLFTEGVPGKVRINLRGEQGTDVLGLARRLGGGGHRQSAGTVISGRLEDVVPRVLNEARMYLDEGLSSGGGGAS